MAEMKTVVPWRSLLEGQGISFPVRFRQPVKMTISVQEIFWMRYGSIFPDKTRKC